jgi:hypothetical protein
MNNTAREEAERRYPGSPQDDNGLTYPMGALIVAYRSGFEAGAQWALTNIDRDALARVLAKRDGTQWDHLSPIRRQYWQVQADAVLAYFNREDR